MSLLTASIPFMRSPQLFPPHSFPKLGKAQAQLGKSASHLLLSLAALRPVFMVALALCLHAAHGQAPPQAASSDVDGLMRTAIAAQQHGDNQSAIENFRKVLAIRPDIVEARAGLGAALAASGQLDAAIAEDTAALDAAPDKTAVRLNLGTAYYKKGDLAHAREQFEAVHAAKPLDVSAAVMLGYVYNKMGRYAEAVDLLTPFEPDHDSNMELEYALAFSLIQTGNVQEGISRMEKVAKATNRADAYVIAGAALLKGHEMTGARIDLEAAMHLDQSIPGVASMAGQACYALEDMKSATLYFQTALRQNPRDFDANLDLGAIRLDEQNFDDARPLLELAVELQPRSPIARLEMAKLDVILEKNAEAAAVLEDLVKAAPNWMDAHWTLATAYYGLNRPEDGKRERMIAQGLKLRQQDNPPDSK
jgi:tetratricopeptide (TPR) repeat protein